MYVQRNPGVETRQRENRDFPEAEIIEELTATIVERKKEEHELSPAHSCVYHDALDEREGIRHRRKTEVARGARMLVPAHVPFLLSTPTHVCFSAYHD